jgi:hypothetical protein
MSYPPIEVRAELPTLGASAAVQRLLASDAPKLLSIAAKASAATGAEPPPVTVPASMINADSKPGSPAAVAASAPAATITTADAKAATEGAVNKPSFFAAHKTEIAVIAAAIGIPMLLLALRAGSDDAKRENEEALRRKYAPKRLTSFQDKFLDAHSRFETESF